MVGEFTRMTRKKQFKEAAACKNEGSQAPDLVPLDSDQQKKPQPVEDSGAISKQLSTLSIPRPSETSRPTTSQSTISTLHPCRGKLPVNTPPSKATTKPRGPRSGSPPRASRQRSRDASRPFPRLLPVKSPATPIPERSYLTRSAMPASKLQNPQPLLLVLDLNGTLLYRPRSSSNYTPRPSLSSFLAHCVSNYSVLVWSSATPFNVTAICSKIFSPEQRKLLLGEWARDTLELDKEQYASKVQVYKRLSRIWQDMRVQRAHPESAKGVRWGQENTLLLDDSVLKASAQPHNAVVLPEFTQEAGEEQKDGTEVLAQVVAYLETGRMVDNVSSFVRSRSFKVDTGWKWDWAKGSSTETELSDDGDDEAGGVKIEEA
ncbi:MAG: hypothetical protein LQ352_001759 [Teloschistes flavicans]|nr:MAG: hypothetical protein LQ352_001759 [Teloschistes flavicans]